MRMARRAAAWVTWTCNTGFAGYSQKRPDFGALFFGILLIYVPKVPAGNAENYRVRL